MHHSIFNYSFIILLLTSSSLVLADNDDPEPVEIINELFMSDTVFSQEKGEWQLTISPQFEKDNENERFSTPIGLEYGITNQFQVELEYTPYISLDSDDEGSQSGRGNFELGLQYSWANINESSISAAVAYEHEFAKGDQAVVGEDGESPKDEDNIFIVLAKSIDPQGNTQAFLQVGREFQDSEKETYFNAGLYSNRGSYTLSGELNWTEEQSFITPGITWKPAEDWEFGVGAPIGVDGEADFKIISNIIYEWE